MDKPTTGFERLEFLLKERNVREPIGELLEGVEPHKGWRGSIPTGRASSE